MLVADPRNLDAAALVCKHSRCQRLTTSLFAAGVLLAGGGYVILRYDSISQIIVVCLGLASLFAGLISMSVVLFLRGGLDPHMKSGAVVNVSDEMTEEYRKAAKKRGVPFSRAELYSYYAAVAAAKKKWMDNHRGVGDKKNVAAPSS